jgi:hypothetical protein
MFAIRTRLSQVKMRRQLQAEILEDRNVLSAFGLMPTVMNLVSAPPLSALVRTVADIVPAVQASVVAPAAVDAAPLQQMSGLLAVTQSAVEVAPLQQQSLLLAVPQIAVDAAPWQQVQALLPDLFGGLTNVDVSPIPSTPVNTDTPATSAAALTVTLGSAGIQVGLQAQAIATSSPLMAPGLAADIGAGGVAKAAVAVIGSAATSNVQMSAATHPGAAGQPIAIAVGARAPSGLTVVPPSDASVASVAPPFGPRDIPNVPLAAPGSDFGPPAGNLHIAAALGGPNDIRVAGLGEPFGPVAPNLPDSDDVSDGGNFAPQSSGLLNGAIPFDLAAMENALQQFLDQLDGLRQDLGSWLRNVGAMPWVLMTFAVAVAAGEIMRRRLRQVQSQEFVSESAKRDALRWFQTFDN